VQWTKQNEQTVYENRWFSVNLGIVGSGWIAPDEGQLVGPCDNGH